jgi:SAM-dependent methyltransferase
MVEGGLVTGPDPGSFRDPGSQVFHAGGEIRRGLRGPAVADWRALAATGFFSRLVQAGKICATEPVESSEPGFELTLRHERIPVVSYPYEWTFSMLRDAALLHLEVLEAALAERMTTKDGSAYNLQWRGTDPVFIDLGSFQRLREGEPWAGYRQFCQTLLYPLLLTAHLGVDFHPWLRARIDGIESGQLRRLLQGRMRWKPGVLKHVYLPDAMQRRVAGTSSRQMSAELKSAGFSTDLVVATVRGLRRLVRRLAWQPPASQWQGYRETCGYSGADQAAKLGFLEATLSGPGQRELVLDLGANDGAYARVAARYARQVVAVESDHPVADALYRRLREEGERRILPLVMDLADPSPGGGWRAVERAPFVGRQSADTVLALAVAHHLAIGRNVPLPQVVELLAALGREVVVEFVDPADPMAQRLLANKPAGLFGDYHRDRFERVLADRFTITRQQRLPSGTRTLYAGVSRG